MALPDLIEIVPLAEPACANVTVPGSKSITNRALILAALAEGEVTLEGALWSEDTQIMVEGLQELGFMVNVQPDDREICSRTITVYGKGGAVPSGGTDQQPLELFVGNAGTAARFLAAFVCLGRGVYRLHGTTRMHERPQAALFQALRSLGYAVEAENGNERLPARIRGSGAFGRVPEQHRAGRVATAAPACSVSIEESSQFASALLLCARAGGWRIEVTGDNAEESPYVAMTSKLIESFPHGGGRFQIEPDASSGSYFVAAGMFVQSPGFMEYSKQFGVAVPTRFTEPIKVAHWPHSGWQVDEAFPAVILTRALSLRIGLGQSCREDTLKPLNERLPPGEISRKRDLGDSIMTAIVLAPFALTPVRFTDLARLRLQECERVAALRTELTKCGAQVVEDDDTLTVHPSALHGAEIETYNDHRMAMCFAVLALKVPGIKIRNPGCVRKTFPNFFQKLAAPFPDGLGATVRDGRTGRALGLEELFAE